MCAVGTKETRQLQGPDDGEKSSDYSPGGRRPTSTRSCLGVFAELGNEIIRQLLEPAHVDSDCNDDTPPTPQPSNVDLA